MNNDLLFMSSIVIYLGSILIIFKLFGKTGLFLFTIFSTILANIQVCRCVNIFGLPTTAAPMLYASTFLVTDILSEIYGKKEAKKAVKYGIAVTILWVIGTQLMLAFTPNANDYLGQSLNKVFILVPRIAFAGLVGYACSQSIDIVLYHKIWGATGNNRKELWLRNNGSTLLSQAIDTLVFVFLAFWGSLPMNVFLSILFTTYFFKAIVAVFDTPFIYAARHITPMED